MRSSLLLAFGNIWLHHNYIATSNAISLQHMQVKRLGIMELSSNLLDRRLRLFTAQ